MQRRAPPESPEQAALRKARKRRESIRDGIIIVLVTSALLGMAFHACLTRPLGRLAVYVTVLFVPLTILYSHWMISMARSNDSLMENFPFWDSIYRDEIVAGATAGLLSSAGLVAILVTAKDLGLLAIDVPLIARSALVIGGGALLFAFRLYFRPYYGMTEVALGAILGFMKTSDELLKHNEQWSDPQVLAAFLSAGVYLVVRGLDNIHQGFTAAKPDRLTAWLRTLVVKERATL